MSLSAESEDLGFRFQLRKNGDVFITRAQRAVTTLRGQAAADFAAEVSGASLFDQQQVMARVTGNYKRGNERNAVNHPRNG
jgi:hypothetical protein